MHLTAMRNLALLVVFAGLSFAVWSLATRSSFSPWYVARWERVSDHLERMEFVAGQGVKVLLYRLNPAEFNFSLEHSQSPTSVKAWASQVPGEHLVINGFYFLENYTPAGLLINDSQAQHAQVFDLDKSGVITLAPAFSIIDTAVEAFAPGGVSEAGQSYPFLLKQGSGSIQADSGLLARRTFMGTDTYGQVYVGLVWHDEVSLFELMNILLEIDTDWETVLNLDGGPSSGLAIETAGFTEVLDSLASVPSVIVIQPK